MAPNEPCPSGCNCDKGAFIDWYMDSLGRRDVSTRSWVRHMQKARLTGDTTLEAKSWFAFHSDPDTKEYRRIWMDMPRNHPVKKRYMKAAEKADKGVADEQVLCYNAELAELTKPGSKKARLAKERQQVSAKQAANMKREAKKTKPKPKQCCSSMEETRSWNEEDEFDGEAYMHRTMEELNKQLGGEITYKAIRIDNKPLPAGVFRAGQQAICDWLNARGDLDEAFGRSTPAPAPAASAGGDEQSRVSGNDDENAPAEAKTVVVQSDSVRARRRRAMRRE